MLQCKFILFFLFFGFDVFASFSNELTLSTGMVSTSFSENPSSIEQGDEINESAAIASGSVSQITLDATYKFSHSASRAYYLRASVPLLVSAGGNFFGAVGANFFFNSISSKYTYLNRNVAVTTVPQVRYYWGTQLGVGYLIYTTETAEKSDIYFELEIHGGGIYNFSKEYGLVGEVGIGRGTGVATSTMNMKLFIGLSYFL